MIINVAEYWERRYKSGGISGAGSRGAEALDKVRIVQEVIDGYSIESVLDLGCGDGVVASMLDVKGYVGYDPSRTAVERCKALMPGFSFVHALPSPAVRFDLVMSLDVMFHLVDEKTYRAHLAALFGWSAKFALVYATNHELRGASHVLHRQWTHDIPAGWSVRQLHSKHKGAWLLERNA